MDECKPLLDGDGVLGFHDMKWMYDQIWKDESTCISFEAGAYTRPIRSST